MSMRTLVGNEFNTRPVWASDLVPGDVVKLKGGPAVVYGWGEAPLSGRIILGLHDVNRFEWSGWTPAACSHFPRSREIVVPPDTRYLVFPDRAKGY